MNCGRCLTVEQTLLKNIPNGEFFTLRKPDGDEPNWTSVWVKGDYDRSSRTYDCYKWSDVNWVSEMKGTRKVWVGFTF